MGSGTGVGVGVGSGIGGNASVRGWFKVVEFADITLGSRARARSPSSYDVDTNFSISSIILVVMGPEAC